MDALLIDLAGLQELIDVLDRRGHVVLGPTVRDGVVVTAPVRAVEELPIGWGDDQEAGRYRLRRRDDDAVFGYAAPAQSAKQVFFPAEEVLWRGRRTETGFEAETADLADDRPRALLGVRSCDLHAVAVHDAVLRDRGFVDDAYAARRADAFVVAVSCTEPGGTCFCASMGTGPRVRAGDGAAFDLALTELLDGGDHRFLVEVGSERGAEVLAEVGARAAGAEDVALAEQLTELASDRMGRTMETDGLKDLLHASADSPVWDDIAQRCLACGNCTAVCPTCFCTTVADHTDLTGDRTERTRVWDTCFSAEFSHLHGGNVRASTRARYRQWLTHKLASWIDQFGTSGCIGCGRCVTWCPVGIDLTAEVAALQRAADEEARP